MLDRALHNFWKNKKLMLVYIPSYQPLLFGGWIASSFRKDTIFVTASEEINNFLIERRENVLRLPPAGFGKDAFGLKSWYDEITLAVDCPFERLSVWFFHNAFDWAGFVLISWFSRLGVDVHYCRADPVRGSASIKEILRCPKSSIKIALLRYAISKKLNTYRLSFVSSRKPVIGIHDKFLKHYSIKDWSSQISTDAVVSSSRKRWMKLKISAPIFLFELGFAERRDQTSEEYMRIVGELIRRFPNMLVKPHPREKSSISEIFDKSRVIDSKIPTELLLSNYGTTIGISSAVLLSAAAFGKFTRISLLEMLPWATKSEYSHRRSFLELDRRSIGIIFPKDMGYLVSKIE